MSAATQFFGGNGDAAPANGADLRIHLVGMAGGGGSAIYYGAGGAGRLLDMTNAIVSTGSTINITIGGGGGCNYTPGSKGGDTTIVYVTPGSTRYGYFPSSPSGIILEGGGGGSAEVGAGENSGRGYSGGSGGGACAIPPSYASLKLNDGGEATKPTQESVASQGGKYVYSMTSSGHPGSPMNFPSSAGGGGGGAGGGAGFNSSQGGLGIVYDFTGANVEYAAGGDWSSSTPPAAEYGRGANSSPQTPAEGTANPGAVFIRYPTIYSEASAVSGNDTGISTSVTPGYYTYVWHDQYTPGSITF